ncbi:NnrU family protein [Stappia sp. ICDLI1TA098]
MSVLIIGLVVFLGIHLLPAFPARRDALRARFGAMPYKLGYSVIALAGLVLVIYGYGLARAQGPIVVYDPPFWLRHLVMLLMLPVFVLLAAAEMPAGHIKKRVKHPMILAVKIWALSHLLVNGDAASLLLFGGFLAWGVIDRISLKRRGNIGGGAATMVSAKWDVIAIVVGLTIYGLFVAFLHQWLIGVPII